ncbi:MAG: ADP-ribosylglycohydrolase family protein [Ignavibacteriaceae bacterium]|nr:ADP-ribosylglycohydrolase family protein [Ignavibacteriaceae bacterium]
MIEVKQRVQNAMIGLAIGDAIGWTSMFRRSFLLPFWTRRIRREMESYSENQNITILPMPFSLNQPSENFDLSPTDDTEWTAFTCEILLNSNYDSYADLVWNGWNKLAHSNEVIRGSIATQSAINNLRRNIQPPQSGKENPHYFDDSAMPRAVPIGIFCIGKPDKAAYLSEIDASITNSEDGIWAAQAIAVAISMLCSGRSITDSIDAAYKYLPKASWIRRTFEETFLMARESKSIFSILPELQKEVVNKEYSYGNTAPETLALAFAILQLHGDNFETALMTSASFAKSSETLPAIVGALVGAMQTSAIGSNSWLEAIKTLKGVCIPSFAGKNYLSLVEQLSNLSSK